MSASSKVPDAERVYIALGGTAIVPRACGYAYHVSSEALERALKCARGKYQRNILRGYEAISGGPLRGSARPENGGSYARSRDSLLKRLSASGVPWCEIRGEHSRRILVIGASRAQLAL